MKKPSVLIQVRTRLLAAAVFLALATVAQAVPFDTPKVDGFVFSIPDSNDWDATDLVVDDSADDNIITREGNIKRLWLTWDQDILYVGVTYQDFKVARPDTHALSVFFDLGLGVGPSSAAVLDSAAGAFLMPDGHNFEMVLRRAPAEPFPGSRPRAFLVTDGSGACQPISGDITVAQNYGGGAKSEARWGLWNTAEFALPWSVVYPGLGGGVPPHAVINAVAVITAGAANRNGIDSAPDNAGLDRGTTPVLLSRLHASVVDENGDGLPDPLNASLAGTATLPLDAGTAALRVRAELVDFPTAGQEPGQPISAVTTAPGVRSWLLPRLAAGRYRVIAGATGYFADTTFVDVTSGQAVTGVDRTLAKTTSIVGTVNFERGIVRPATLRIADADGVVLDSAVVSAAGGAFTLAVENSGTYTLTAEADDYYPYEQSLAVTAGVDITGLSVDLALLTEISGEVVYLGGTPQPGQIELFDATGSRVDIAGFYEQGTGFRFFVAEGGTYTLSTSTEPDFYVEVDTTITVVQDVDVTGLILEMPLKTQVDAQLSLEGPAAASNWRVFYGGTDRVRAEGTFTAPTTISFYVAEGSYRLVVDGPGYVERTVPFTATLNDTTLGNVQLLAVRASHLEIVNDLGATQAVALATYYDPANDPWTSSRVQLAARDDAGRDDLYDLDGRLSGFRLSARKMDDLSPTSGTPVFYRDGTEAAVDSVVSFTAARAQFWISNTAVEVLRVYLAQPNKEPIAGRIVVAFQDPQPTTVVLTADADTLVADGIETVIVSAQLFDSAGNRSLLDGVPVNFGFDSDTVGQGQFEEPTTFTNGDGLATARLTATGAGPLLVSASVVIENRVLAVEAEELGSGKPNLVLTSLPGATAGWRLSVPATVSDLQSPVPVTAQLIDTHGNATREAGRTILFTADPPGLGSFEPALAASDTSGRARSVFTPSGASGLITITGDGGGLAGDEIGLQLRDVQVISDPVWYEEPAEHQTFDKTDLTALVIDNTPAELILELPFQSDWNGLQLHVIFETEFNAAGAPSDPFAMPVNYGHAQKPDYALTTKYSANDYGDFRRYNISPAGWLFWDLDDESFKVDGQATNPNVLPAWVSKEADRVVIRLPWTAFGGAPDSLRLEAYLTQEDREKRAAFDSVPQDATLNLDFDYVDPPTGAWDVALGPTTLTQWGRTYVVKTDFPTPPTLSGATVTPAAPAAGELITLRTTVTNAGDGIGDVLADLSAMGGGKLAHLRDDGNATHGDAVAGDGVYGLMAMVPIGNPGGSQDLIISAYDGGNVWPALQTVTIDVIPNVEPLIAVADSVGDDHGPNQPGVARKYITYPSNIVFPPGSFDLTGLTVFETVAVVGGEQVEMVAFQVTIGDLPDPKDPGRADWNPLYADLNVEKIDILIDSKPGGATASLPNRIAGFQPWDAWDYAVIIDGWYKAIIPSEGANTVDTWRENALRADKDIILLGDPDLDTVTALVSREALGNPTADDIRSWDIAVCMSSHDFGGEEVLGGIRWVNEFRSEWNFGGGRDGNRDSNLIDLLLVPGTGHSPGLPQESILDYETPDALARLERGDTPVAIEMSQFEDTGPPVIDTGGGGSVVTKVAPLEDAPLALTVRITDDNRVAEARFRYRSTGYTGGGWQHEAPMSFIGSDLWVVDILPSFLDSLVVSPIDSTRYLEFEVWAQDVPSGVPAVAKESTSPVTTLEISPAAPCLPKDTDLARETVALLEVDGSAVVMDAALRDWLVRNHVETAWTGEAASADTMGPHVDLQWDTCNVPTLIKTAPTVPAGRPVGVFRQFFLATSDSLGGYVDLTGPLPRTMELSLHYPEAWLPAGLNRSQLAMYKYEPQADRWVLAGGRVNLTGNKVSTAVTSVGTYGLFATEAISQDPNEVISGIFISPNPFSPNGDGLYDECSISFSLNQEVTVTVEIFNIDGTRKNVLAQTFSYAGQEQGDAPQRVSGLVWDGRDFSGDVVPYGIYVLRIEASYNLADGTRRVFRENFSVAVIK